MIESLYKKIKNFPHEGNIKTLFNDLKLDGFKFLKDMNIPMEDEILIAKYCCEAYDPESPLHEIHKDRRELKLAIYKQYGIKNEGVFEEVTRNENENFNKYVAWYYRQIKDFDFEAIVTGQELLTEQLEVARTRIQKKKGALELDDDKFLKAMNLKNLCYTNAVDNIDKVNQLKRNYQKKYETTDKDIHGEVPEEVLRSSGVQEVIAYERKQKNKRDGS